MRECPFCFTTTEAGLVPSPFTTEDLRWYFADAEAAMGMRSSHGAVEALLASGPPPLGGQANAAENRMLRAIGPAGRHRCIRNHRLAGLSPRLHAVLRAAYDGEDWTRTLDGRVGYGARLNLQHLFPHEALQVATLTPTVARALRPKKPVRAPMEPATPVYRSGHEHLASVRTALSLPDDAPIPDIRARLRDIATYFRKATLLTWEPDIARTIEALRAATGERGEARQVLQAARERVSEGIRLSTMPELTLVVGTTQKRPVPPPTAQSYLLKLIASGRKDTLAKVKREAEALLKEAHEAAHVAVLPKGFKVKARKPRKGVSRTTPLSAVETLPSEETSDALCA